MNLPPPTTRLVAGHTHRAAALATAVSLLSMAVLAPLANFGVINAVVVPTDAAAAAGNIAASMASFRFAIAALLVVAILDVVVAWGLYVLLRPANENLALLVAWLRLAYAGVFAVAVANLLDAAGLVAGAPASAAPSVQLGAQVATALASFTNAWDLGLAIFGVHLVGLGVLLARYVAVPRVLGVLVAVAGAGYLADTFGRVLVQDYSITISLFTFVGEVLLIAWLFRVGFAGTPSRREGSSSWPRTRRRAPATADG